MKRQRVLSALAVTASFVVIAGCSSSTTNQASKSSDSSSTSTSSSSSSSAAGSTSAADSGSTSSAPAASTQATSSLEPSGAVTITVNCEPPTTQKADRQVWLDDVADFMKLHPKIKIVGQDESPCDDPNTFLPKLQSGQEANVFYAYVTDIQQAINTGQVLDIQSYAKDVPQLANLQQNVVNLFRKDGKDGGDLYGLPFTNYTMGLIYNRKLFQQAGLDPSSPPTTWAEVRADAKKIAALGSGYSGYADYTGANNVGGWHFTAEMYSQGGDVVGPDGKVDIDNAKGDAVLSNLKTMRWQDKSMSSQSLLQWADLNQLMASGKNGMMIGAPDVFTVMHDSYNATLADFGMGPMPAGDNGSGTLVGGDGFLFNKSDSPDQVKAGLLWLEYHGLTPGVGQFNYKRALEAGKPVGLPEPNLFTGDLATQDAQAKQQYATVPTENFQAYIDGTAKLPLHPEPPNAQAIYKVLDNAVSAVMTNQSSDPKKVLSTYAPQVQAVIDNVG